MTTTIQGPDGALIDFPEGTSETEMNAAMAQAYPHQAPAGPGVMAGVSRALETNLPFVDRAVAAAKSTLPQGYGGTGQDYSANLATERAKNAQFAEQNPWTNAVGGITAYAPAALIPGGSGLAGRVGTGALTGFGLGGVQGASNSPDLTNTQETGRSIAEGELSGGALGGVFPAAAHGIGQGYSALADALRGGPGPADLAALGAAKNAAYQNVKDLGAAYSPQSFKSLTDKIASDAAKADIDPDLNPKATKIIANLQNRSAEAVKSGTPVTLTDLDKARQFVNDNLSGLPEPKQARFGSLIKDNIDDFVNTAFPGDMVPMPAKTAAAAPSGQGTLPLDAIRAAPGPTPADVSGAAVSGAVGSRENAPPSPGLVVARRLPNDDVQYGKPGDLHYHLLGDPDNDPFFMEKLNGLNPDDLGFARPGGPFMTREEAAQTMGTKGPLEAASFNGPFEPKGFNAQPPQVPPGPAPTPMLDFLRSSGGLKDEGGDLSSMGFSNLKGVAAKGSSKIIDKENGLPMDEARRMAVEQGYMEPHETVSDFINKLGEHPTYSVHDEEAVAARAARDAYDSGPEHEPLATQERAPEDFAGLGEAPPAMTRQPAAPVAPGSPASSPPVASAKEAAAAIQNARDLAQRQFKANALLDALNKAKINAAKQGIGGNTENAARQRLAAILDQEPWSPDEKAQLNKMVLGTRATNAMREASRLSPFQNTLMKVAEGTSFFGAPTTTTLAAALGSGAHLAGNIARRSNQNELMRTILAGGKAPAQTLPRQGPVSRAAMAAALGVNADLQAPRN